MPVVHDGTPRCAVGPDLCHAIMQHFACYFYAFFFWHASHIVIDSEHVFHKGDPFLTISIPSFRLQVWAKTLILPPGLTNIMKLLGKHYFSCLPSKICTSVRPNFFSRIIDVGNLSLSYFEDLRISTCIGGDPGGGGGGGAGGRVSPRIFLGGSSSPPPPRILKAVKNIYSYICILNTTKVIQSV